MHIQLNLNLFLTNIILKKAINYLEYFKERGCEGWDEGN